MPNSKISNNLNLNPNKTIMKEEMNPIMNDKKWIQSIQDVLDFLHSQGFKRGVDRSPLYHENCDVHWKKLPCGRYLVFYHINARKSIFKQLFDPVILDMHMVGDKFHKADIYGGTMLDPDFRMSDVGELKVIKQLIAGVKVDLSRYDTF